MKPIARVAERVLASIGASICILAAVQFWEGYAVLGLPNLYLLEIALIGIFVAAAAFAPDTAGTAWGFVPWIGSGILFAFVILGMWTIGPFLLPAAGAFLLLGYVRDRRLQRPSNWHLLAFLASGAIQGAMIWSLFTRAGS